MNKIIGEGKSGVSVLQDTSHNVGGEKHLEWSASEGETWKTTKEAEAWLRCSMDEAYALGYRARQQVFGPGAAPHKTRDLIEFRGRVLAFAAKQR